nr:hypothetical protein BaRGS_029604 [Batillaria attramentaria]
MVLVGILGFLPLPLLVEGKEARCAYILMIMATLWLTEALPIPVTALLPVCMFPMAGVLTASDVGHSYFSNTSLLFIGGLVVAIGVEECQLHKRIALMVLRRVGADPKWIMLGLMIPTWFLSMWISNTATASMMIPIVEAVLAQIKAASDLSEIPDSKSESDNSTELDEMTGEKTAFLKDSDHGVKNGVLPENKEKETSLVRLEEGLMPLTVHLEDRKPAVEGRNNIRRTSHKTSEDEDNVSEKGVDEKEMDRKRRLATQHAQLAKGLSLCIAYAGNVGGIATLTGTPPNLVLKGQTDMFFAKYGEESPLTFVVWMALGFPLALLLLAITWLWLVLMFLRGCCSHTDERQKEAVTATIQQEYKKLGKITFAEIETLVLFILLALMWISRDPKFVSGWSALFEEGYVTDATGAILIAVLFFILPCERPQIFCLRGHDGGTPLPRSYTPLLTWKTAQNKLPWGIIILLGGGFALAKACKYSGLSLWVGYKLSGFGDLDPWILNLIICTAVAMATEVTSNTATATLLMPIMAELAIRIGVNPLYLCSSTALATSFAFMMPVATPPNAIVFSHGHLTIPDMAKPGFLMNLTAVLCLTLAVNTWGASLLNFDTLPASMVNATQVATP